jgi:hypothetical protein
MMLSAAFLLAAIFHNQKQIFERNAGNPFSIGVKR